VRVKAKGKVKDPRDVAVEEAILAMKASEYGVTAIKVELEAQLNRVDTRSRSQLSALTCANCEGSGDVYNDDDEDYEDCLDCGGTGEVARPGADRTYNFGSETDCKAWLENHVSEGAKKALIFGKFYRDGSVDSEYTFTMPINKPEYVVEFIYAWKALAQAIGNGINTDGAGMHIAILNDKKGRYPVGNKLDRTCSDNFKYAMDRLMPALFFLASPDHKSRGLHFRMPMVGMGTKYSAIAGHQNVFEYRVFETCYDRPEAFYDMFCVIANSLKFYKKERVELPFFGKIGKLGFKDGTGLDRFYYTAKHVEALEAGVEALRPSYKTMEQLKKERGFKLSSTVVLSQEKKQERQWMIAYNEYKSLMAYQNEVRTKRMVKQYEDMLRVETKSWVEANYGKLDQYLTKYAKPSAIESAEEYVKTCKKAFNNNGVLTTIEV